MASAQSGRESLRCRWLGHIWHNPSLPTVYPVTWCAGGAEHFLICRRCGVSYDEVSR